MTDSMHNLEAARLAADAEKAKDDSVVSSILPTRPARSASSSSNHSSASSSSATSPTGAKIEPKVDAESAPQVESEAHFRQALDELSNAQETPSEPDSVFDTVESKFKNALSALVEFMESLKLDQKMRSVVAEFEPTFAKFEEKVISPINQFGERTSKDFQSEMSSFQKELNQLRSKIQVRIDQISSSDSKSQETQAEAADEPFVAPHNALEDLRKLEDMGFPDRRRNLELLAVHKGDINAVVAALLE